MFRVFGRIGRAVLPSADPLKKLFSVWLKNKDFEIYVLKLPKFPFLSFCQNMTPMPAFQPRRETNLFQNFGSCFHDWTKLLQIVRCTKIFEIQIVLCTVPSNRLPWNVAGGWTGKFLN